MTRLSGQVIDAAWPDWWTEEAEYSKSAQAELRFSLARKLGLEPRSLLNDAQPKFVWDESAKYKNFTGDIETDKAAISAFGISISNLLIQSSAEPQSVTLNNLSAALIREALLGQVEFIGTPELLTFLWGINIPVIHLRLYPLTAKRMCAMAVKVRGQYAILLAKDSKYPAATAFHLAHEIGHIALGHLAEHGAIIDIGDPVDSNSELDSEELAADKFALELLTGFATPPIEVIGRGKSAKQLATEAFQTAKVWSIEPGTVALCYGHITGNWGVANAAMKYIYDKPKDVWQVINTVAKGQLQIENLPLDSRSFLLAVLGGK